MEHGGLLNPLISPLPNIFSPCTTTLHFITQRLLEGQHILLVVSLKLLWG